LKQAFPSFKIVLVTLFCAQEEVASWMGTDILNSHGPDHAMRLQPFTIQSSQLRKWHLNCLLPSDETASAMAASLRYKVWANKGRGRRMMDANA
jgi:hypothetical protein